LVKALTPADATVTVLMPPGRSEHGYEPTAADVEALGTADLVVYVGLNLEPQVAKFLAAHPSSRRVDVCWARELGLGEATADHAEEAAHQEHDEHEGHDHGSVDQHVWLDPVLVKRMVPVMSAAVRKAGTNAGLAPSAPSPDGLLARVEAVDAAYRERLGPLKDRAIVTHHNAWGRIAERYGLKVAAVLRPFEMVEPTSGEIFAVVEAVRKEGVRTIFVEPQFNAEAARRVAEEAGVKLKVLDPLGDGDWEAMMRKNLEALAEGLE
jgi:zinc transport system substrate-binding protein